MSLGLLGLNFTGTTSDGMVFLAPLIMAFEVAEFKNGTFNRVIMNFVWPLLDFIVQGNLTLNG